MVVLSRPPFEDDTSGRGGSLYALKASMAEHANETSAPAPARSKSGLTERPSALRARSTPLPGKENPHVHHATASRVVKGEDVLFVHPLALSSQPQSLLYMVCDGHCGPEAANFVSSNFLPTLNSKLPPKLPDFDDSNEVNEFAAIVRRALAETFVQTDNDWSQMGHFSGTTVTVVLATGWLLTTANTGDSAAVIDTGASWLELTRSHRIQSNLEEQARLRGAGQHLAQLGFHLQGPAKPGETGVGPLRLWPGGLCVSRSVGDLDAGPEVVPVPHVKQLLLPKDGCRVIMASDGLWDVLTFTKALKLTRSKPTGAAASALITAVSRDKRTMDDASIVVIDLLPTESTSFPTVALRAGSIGLSGPNSPTSSGATSVSSPNNGAAAPSKRAKSGGLFSCFRSDDDDGPPAQPPAPSSNGNSLHGGPAIPLLADVDCLVADPGLKDLLARTSIDAATLGPPPARSTADYTMHGGSTYLGGAVAPGDRSTSGSSDAAALLQRCQSTVVTAASPSNTILGGDPSVRSVASMVVVEDEQSLYVPMPTLPTRPSAPARPVYRSSQFM